MESAQAKLVKASADFENIQSQSQRTFQLVERGIMAKSKADESRAALEGSKAAVTGAEADLAKAREELGHGRREPAVAGDACGSGTRSPQPAAYERERAGSWRR